jgi:hypothetical protein
MSRIDYEVAPAGAFARAFPIAVGGMVALGLLVTIVTVGLEQPTVLVGALPAFLAAIAVMAALSWVVRHPRVRLEDGVLTVGRMPRVRAAVADIDLDAARIVDLEAERELQPALRLIGTTLPGYRAGWFWLRDGSRAFLVLTEWKRVLVLPRRNGGRLLLSLQRPEALLEALRRARG